MPQSKIKQGEITVLRLFKIIFYLFLIMFLLSVVGGILAIFLVDPNQYKSEIIKQVEESTGRPLSIEGKIQWTFFPVLGIKVNEVTLGNPPSFPKGDFFSVKYAEFSVAFRPLIHRQIQVGKIILDHLNLNLIKNASGQVNWQDHESGSSRSKFEVKSENLEGSEKNDNNNPKQKDDYAKSVFTALAEVDIKDSRISYDDEQQNKKLALNQLQLVSKDIRFNKLFPVKASAVFISSKIKNPINISLNTNMLIDSNKLRLQDLDAITNQYHWQGWIEMNYLKKDPSALNGLIHFSGKNGAFQGIDLYYYSDLADAMIHQTEPTRQDTHQTPFDNIQGVLDIQNGIINTHDLLLQAQKINASGSGTVNLITQQLDEKILLQRLTEGAEAKPRGPAIPILVTGSFSDPKIRPDWTSIAVTQIKSQIEAQIEKHKDQIPEDIQKGLRSLLGN